MTNPYAAPSPAPSLPTARPVVGWHRQAWQVPLVGLAISIFLNSAGRALGLGVLGGVIFIASILIGWIITCIVIFQVLSGRGRVGNLIGGLITNALLTLLVAGSLHAVSLARQAAIDARRKAAADSQPLPDEAMPVDSPKEPGIR